MDLIFRNFPGGRWRIVTTVGGTDLSTSPARAAPGVRRPLGRTAAAAFRRINIPIPSWQTAAAAGCSSCSKSYRNAPDVSANANYTFYVCADQTTCTANEYGGTSFAAPMWAGYMALVNQQAVINSGKPVGFINPSLYSIGVGSSYPRFPRHHQRQQRLFGNCRLRSGYRLGQPKRKRPDRRTGGGFGEVWLQPFGFAQFRSPWCRAAREPPPSP